MPNHPESSELGEVVSLGIKEWVVTEGIVSDSLVKGDIRLPAKVAERLDLANRLLIGTTAILNAKLGSFGGEPLAIRALAGIRTWQDNMAIAHSVAMFGWCRRHMGILANNPYDPNRDNFGLKINAPCLADLDTHLDGRSVDVAIIGLDTDRVITTGNCYQVSYLSKDAQPRSFSGVKRYGSIEQAAAIDLLHGAMRRAGFTRPDPHVHWHFEYNEKS